MTSIPYYDFDLWLLPNGENFHALVIDSPAGQAITPFVKPFTDRELEEYLRPISQGFPGRERHKEILAKIGGRLFEALMQGEILEAYRRSTDAAQDGQMGLRIRLRLTDAPALGNLPWEFLFDQSRNEFLALSKDTPIVRFINLPERIRPLVVEPPLNILFMVASPRDYPQFDLEGEWQHLKEALSHLESQGKVSIDRIEETSVDALIRQLRLKPYHLFHFIGIGEFDEVKQDGWIGFTDTYGNARKITGEMLGTLLRDSRTLRIAIMDTGETAKTSRSNALSGIAPQIVRLGIPAVIGMQFLISDEASIKFNEEFYTVISEGFPVDAAVNEARLAVYSTGNTVEWGTPVLFLRAKDGIVFTNLSSSQKSGSAKGS